MSHHTKLFDERTPVQNAPPQTPVDAFGQRVASQVATETISTISNKASHFAAEKKEQLYEKFDATYAKLTEFYKKGHWTLQTFCFAGAIAVLVLSILSFISIFKVLLDPLHYLINVYVLILAFFLMVFEFPYEFSPLRKFRQWAEVWIRAFERLIGRGIFYLFLGALIISTYGAIFGWIIGAYIVICGLVSIFFGLMLSRKLTNMRNELQDRFGNDFERIQQQFSRFDTDHNGYIDATEFTAMCSSMGVELTTAERDYALNMLDKDHDGVIDIYEFAAWFNSRSKQYV